MRGMDVCAEAATGTEAVPARPDVPFIWAKMSTPAGRRGLSRRSPPARLPPLPRLVHPLLQAARQTSPERLET